MTEFDPSKLKYDERGLVPVVAQEATTGEVLMVAWANREALETARTTGRMHYFSRSREKLWEKGEDSGHRQALVRLAADCDRDTVLALVHQTGPACHTSAATCFGAHETGVARPALAQLDAAIQDRKASPQPTSYTSKLLADPRLAGKKIGEEAAELVMALATETDARVAEEAADLLYHLLVACAARSVDLKSILAVLEKRRK